MLIVDDFPGAATMLSEVISELAPGRYSFDTGINGREAISLALMHPPDMVLIDIEMPLMNGLDAGATIRSAFQGSPPFMIAMSGNPDGLSRAEALGVFDRIMAKPLDFDELSLFL